MTSDEAFAKITIILAPHLSEADYHKHNNPMPEIRSVLEELEMSARNKLGEEIIMLVAHTVETERGDLK